MYSNVGRFIKKYVKVVVIINDIFFVFCGMSVVLCAVLSWEELKAENLILSIFLGAITIALGWLLTRIWGAFLYAYGEVAERVISIDERIEKYLSEQISTDCATNALEDKQQ